MSLAFAPTEDEMPTLRVGEAVPRGLPHVLQPSRSLVNSWIYEKHCDDKCNSVQTTCDSTLHFLSLSCAVSSVPQHRDTPTAVLLRVPHPATQESSEGSEA